MHSICCGGDGCWAAASLGGAVAFQNGAVKIITQGPVYSIACDESSLLCSFRLQNRVAHHVFDSKSLANVAKVEFPGANSVLSKSAVFGSVIGVADEPSSSMKLVEWKSGRVICDRKLKGVCLDVLLFNYKKKFLAASLSNCDFQIKQENIG